MLRKSPRKPSLSRRATRLSRPTTRPCSATGLAMPSPTPMIPMRMPGPIDQTRSGHRPPLGAGVRSGCDGRFGLRVAVFQPTAERMDDGQADDEQTDADEDLDAAFFCLEPNFARSGE